jgi:hypothetical protein
LTGILAGMEGIRAMSISRELMETVERARARFQLGHYPSRWRYDRVQRNRFKDLPTFRAKREAIHGANRSTPDGA